MIALPQNKFREIILPKILASDLAKVFLGHTVVDLTQGPTSATVTAADSAGSQIQLTASFVVGADGSKSVVRKRIDAHLDGFTWDQLIVAVDMLIDLAPPKDGPSSMYYVHPVDFAFLSLIEKPRETGPNPWRCTLAMTPDEAEPDVFDANLRRKLEELMPGPRPLEYKLLRSQPYRIHQRNTHTMYDGRCLLVGDAAHLTNPWGGLGLTTGILDVDSLADALGHVINDGGPEAVLDTWSKARLDVFQNIVSPLAAKNFRRCYEVDPEYPLADTFFRAIHEHSSELQVANQSYNRMVTDMKSLLR